jgi:glyoxylate carboligase
MNALFATREWTTVRVYPATNEDGHETAVHVMAMPAKFYRIVCPDLGIRLDTGSGMERLACEIAQAIADGMLGQANTVERA